MNNVKNIVLRLSLVLFSLLFIGAYIGQSMSQEESKDVQLSGFSSARHPSVKSAEKPVNNDDSYSIVHLLVNDDALEKMQRPLEEIWQSYLISFEENNKSAERLDEEAYQRDLLLAKDAGEEIEGEILQLPPVVPADYTGHYLGREKFTIVLSSFENLDFYESLFVDLRLVEFKRVDYSYLELYAVAEALNKSIPDSQATVNSVLGRITLSLFNDTAQKESVDSVLKTMDAYNRYKAYIDIQIVEPNQTL